MSDQPATPLAKPRWPRIVAAALLAAGLVLSGFFGLRTWRQYEFTQRVARGEVQVESLRGWMTLPYIERVYGVPQADLRAALGLPATGFEDRSLREWLSVQGVDPQAGRRTIENLILDRGTGAGPQDQGGRTP